MEWDADKQDQDLLSFMKQLIKTRKTNSAFTDNARFGLLEANNDSGLLVFTRGHGAQQMIVALNNGETSVHVELPEAYSNSIIRDAWSQSNEVLGQEALSFTLEPQQFRIYSVES
ncbi:Cyclomaltodextrinase [compost metagenome]